MQSFNERLDYGDPAEEFVLRWLLDHGYFAYRPMFESEDNSMYAKYQFDLVVQHPTEGNIIETIEVKRRELNFTSAQDFPYGTVVVDEKKTYDSKSIKPLATVVANRELSAAIIVPSYTTSYWVCHKRRNRLRSNKPNIEYYECPKKLCLPLSLLSVLIDGAFYGVDW